MVLLLQLTLLKLQLTFLKLQLTFLKNVSVKFKHMSSIYNAQIEKLNLFRNIIFVWMNPVMQLSLYIFPLCGIVISKFLLWSPACSLGFVVFGLWSSIWAIY